MLENEREKYKRVSSSCKNGILFISEFTEQKLLLNFLLINMSIIKQ